MIEAIVEGGGLIAGLALLLYFQVLRPDKSRPVSDEKTSRDGDRPT